MDLSSEIKKLQERVLELEKKLDLFSQNKLKHKTSNIKFNEKYFGHLSYEDSIEKAFQRIIG